MKRFLAVVLVLASLAGAYVAWVRPQREGAGARPGAPGSEAKDRPVSVSTALVARRDVAIDLEGIGSVAAYKTVTIRAQVDGRLEKVLFREGETVKAGQALAQIDSRPFAIQLRQAQASLARDQALATAAQLNLERYGKLAEQKFAAQQQADDQRALLAQYQSAVAADEAQIASAQLNLSYARIVSPIDGVTGVRMVDPGNLVRAADSTGIVVVTQLDPIAVLFTLPQDDLPDVMEQLSAGKVLSVDAYDRAGVRKLASGQLLLVDNQINQATATIRLKATFPNPDRQLWPNQFVKTRLHVSVRRDALVVPTTAVQRGPQGTFVYVVTPKSTVEARNVEIALALTDLSVVKSGLVQDERVVVDGQNQLRDGAKVHVLNMEGQAAARAREIQP